MTAMAGFKAACWAVPESLPTMEVSIMDKSGM